MIDVHKRASGTGRVVFPESNCPLRTNDQFLNLTDDGYHNGPTPLSTLSITFVCDFVLDYMHLICLGVTRRLLKSWISNGPLSVRLPARAVQEISSTLLSFSSYIPRDFVRKQRALSEIDRWKANEFRLFVLYTGIVALKGKLSEELYNNFLLLSVSCNILLNPTLHNNDLYHYADKLLNLFVVDLKQLYRNTNIMFTV